MNGIIRSTGPFFNHAPCSRDSQALTLRLTRLADPGSGPLDPQADSGQAPGSRDSQTWPSGLRDSLTPDTQTSWPRHPDPQAHETPIRPLDSQAYETHPTSDPQDTGPSDPGTQTSGWPRNKCEYRIPNFHANYLDRGCPPAQEKQTSAPPSDPAQTDPVKTTQELPVCSKTYPLALSKSFPCASRPTHLH